MLKKKVNVINKHNWSTKYLARKFRIRAGLHQNALGCVGDHGLTRGQGTLMVCVVEKKGR